MPARRPRLPARLGAPQSPAHAAALMRALKPLIAQVRASLPRVRTPADARALGVALRRAWPDARLRGLLGGVGRAAEGQASRPWAPLDRAASAVRDSRMRNGVGSSYSEDEVFLGYTRTDARKPREYDGAKLVDRWTRDATKLISSVRDEVAEGLRRDVIAAAEAGTPADELAARWIRQGIPVERGTLEGRMRVIAQHQLSTLHAQVQSERARAVGVTDFVWRTQQDERVRDEHAALEGTRHAYADPPSEGLPGEPVNCRCWAESVISDELAESLGFGIGLSPGLEGGRRS
jgi:SPP1 gp7 family putative phage head morphogenesis protein